MAMTAKCIDFGDRYHEVARTFADMEGSEKIRKRDILSALMARDMDKDSIQMTPIKG